MPPGIASIVAPTPPAIAISASATARPPSEQSCTVLARAGADEAAHEIAVAALGREIDRRRSALLAAEMSLRYMRLAEPALRVADEEHRLAPPP